MYYLLIAMSEGLRMAITLMNLIEEMAVQEIGKFNTCTKEYCKVFKDRESDQGLSI